MAPFFLVWILYGVLKALDDVGLGFIQGTLAGR